MNPALLIGKAHGRGSGPGSRPRLSDTSIARPALLETLGRSASDAASANAWADPFLALRYLGLAVSCLQVVNTTGLRALLPNVLLYLLGRVTEREATRATELARGVSGVQKVVRVFEILTEAELAALGGTSK